MYSKRSYVKNVLGNGSPRWKKEMHLEIRLQFSCDRTYTPAKRSSRVYMYKEGVGLATKTMVARPKPTSDCFFCR